MGVHMWTGVRMGSKGGAGALCRLGALLRGSIETCVVQPAPLHSIPSHVPIMSLLFFFTLKYSSFAWVELVLAAHA